MVGSAYDSKHYQEVHQQFLGDLHKVTLKDSAGNELGRCHRLLQRGPLHHLRSGSSYSS